ncbi:PQQ-binding-like beta-propeller repeat protein, partial [Halovivax sp.]|uniref:outer membrane protein assembly factor BamB family protein n=1 Tax=Halovivax sp. TaxID=1935978 RepID=UPI0037442A45
MQTNQYSRPSGLTRRGALVAAGAGIATVVGVGRAEARAGEGELLWHFEDSAGQPTVEDGVVYSTTDGNLFALDGEDGDELWTAEGAYA